MFELLHEIEQDVRSNDIFADGFFLVDSSFTPGFNNHLLVRLRGLRTRPLRHAIDRRTDHTHALGPEYIYVLPDSVSSHRKVRDFVACRYVRAVQSRGVTRSTHSPRGEV